MQTIEKHLCKKRKIVLYFFLHSWNPFQIFNILNKKMTLIVYVFPKVRTAKKVVR